MGQDFVKKLISIICILMSGVGMAQGCSCEAGWADISRRLSTSEELYVVKNLEVSKTSITIRILNVLKGDKKLTGQIVKDIDLEQRTNCDTRPAISSAGKVYITESPGSFSICSPEIELNEIFENPLHIAKLQTIDPDHFVQHLWDEVEESNYEKEERRLLVTNCRMRILEDNTILEFLVAIFLSVAIPFSAGAARAGLKRAFSAATVAISNMAVILIVVIYGFPRWHNDGVETWAYIAWILYIFGLVLSIFVALRKPNNI